MNYKPTSADRQGTEKVTFMYEGVDLNEFPKRLDNFFASEKYKLESGTTDDGVYGTGNKTMRILFGAFVKRHSFKVKMYGKDNTVKFEFALNSSGISGGVIGMNKAKDEFMRIYEKIKNSELPL